MIINPLTGQRVTDSKSSNKAKAVSSTSFFDLLTDQLQGPEETQVLNQAEALTTENPVPAELRLAGLSMSENTIDLLESFSQALGELRLSASDLLPLVEALEDDTTTLLDIKEQLPQHDPLAQLIDRVATVSTIEAEKFRRGDYN
ncbi:MAG: hypothetical protein PHI06_06540 [Desulfobulbaceae bacterium]|nr:hypothetical protein [Desulfobulbaceae bacterium]